MADQSFTARLAASVGGFPAEAWDALAGADNPFVSHAFLTALEDSGSVGPGTGWTPGAAGDRERRKAACSRRSRPIAKSHSQGEYVFDHAWADAWERAGRQLLPQAADRGAVHPGDRAAAAAGGRQPRRPAAARGRGAVPR